MRRGGDCVQQCHKAENKGVCRLKLELHFVWILLCLFLYLFIQTFFILSISILFTKSFHVVSCPGFTGLHIIVLQSGNPGSDQHKHRNIKNKFGKTRFHRTGSLYIIVHSIVRPTQQNINNRVEQTRLHRTTLCNGSLISFFSD